MPESDLSHSEKRLIWIEIGVVVILGVFLHTLAVVLGRFWEPDLRSHSLLTSAYQIGTCIQTAVPLLWIMSRSGRPWSYYGFRRLDWRLDISLAGLLPLVIVLSSLAAAWMLYFAAWGMPWSRHLIAAVPADYAGAISRRAPKDGASWAIFPIYLLANGIAEEFVLRGYLLPRIKEATKSAGVAVVAVSAMAAAYHLYQGSYSAIVIFFGQAVLCWLYLKAPRVIPFAVAHAIYDLGLYLWYPSHQ